MTSRSQSAQRDPIRQSSASARVAVAILGLAGVLTGAVADHMIEDVLISVLAALIVELALLSMLHAIGARFRA